MKKSGFTLAEVLLTLVVIGVIAALTIGTVVSNTSKKQFEAKTKKFYTQFANAFEMYKVNNGINEFEIDEEFNPDEFAFNYLKVSSRCDKSSDSKCFSDKYYSKNGGVLNENNMPAFGSHTYKLDDGSVFAITHESIPTKLVFDVNGIDKPNKGGYDLWSASIHTDGRLDDSAITPQIRNSSSASELSELVNEQYETYCNGDNYSGCFGYFIRNGFKIVD